MMPAFRLALAVLAATACSLAVARPALVASSPAKNQVLDAPPIEVRLTFNQHVEPRKTSLKLVSAQNRIIDTDRAHADRNDANSVAMTVPVLRSGTYRARWLAIGDDGQKTRGEFSFTIK